MVRQKLPEVQQGKMLHSAFGTTQAHAAAQAGHGLAQWQPCRKELSLDGQQGQCKSATHDTEG